MSRWDLVTLSALIFTAFVTPYEVALLPGSKIEDPDTWDELFWVNMFVNLIFLKDMLMQFFLAYRIQGGTGQVRRITKLLLQYPSFYGPVTDSYNKHPLLSQKIENAGDAREKL